MVRRSLYLTVLVVLLLVFLVPANAVFAQKPEPPNPDLEGLDSPPALDMQNPPEPIQKAVALQESLTPEQHAAARAILDKYQPEMQSIAESLFAAGKPAADVEPEPIDADMAARTAAMMDDIVADMATVLDADQLALFRAALDPESSVPDLAGAAPDASPAGTQGYTSNCFYSPYYMAYGKYYAYYGYQYAYLEYYYHSTTYSYYAYYYAYYGYWYSRDSLDYSAPGYFGGYYTGMVSNEDSYSYYYWAYLYAYYAQLYSYYAYYYAYYQYVYYGYYSYGYYSYYYNYYGQLYTYYSYYDAYYCYYYW